ncbi:MAG: Methyl-accepting chemotaxis protein I [Herbaspirillum frisingense]|uniref:Methyl-accepting chemotaxis protein I n=1 Tax=Herbaspirillum frisingense TaxID=92645 RepID=A0A7V8FVZ7_9BURK|nr:MAG: Methyl-accepting chemotaxis protein I [Herbaspirillum frisingense]
MFSKISIKARITAAIGVLVCLLIVAGVIGQISNRAGEAALQETYSIQLASAVAIGESKYNLAIARIAIDRALLHPESGDMKALVDKTRDYLKVSDNAWRRYLDLPKSEEEAAIAKEVAAKRDIFIQQAIEPALAALQSNDTATADRITMQVAPPLSLNFTRIGTQLDQYLLKHGQKTYENFSSQLQTVSLVFLCMIAVGIVVGIFCGWGLHRAIARPLHQALQHFSAISEGDLGRHIAIQSQDEMGKLMSGLKGMRDGLRATVTAVRRSVDSIATATSQIASGNTDLSQRTEEQAASLEETAASMEELTSAVKQNSESAREASAVASEAESIALRGGEVTDQVVSTMRDIQSSSDKMSAIITVIDGIAFQTNILALNAAVEAARAGEQGRGFAVVATEVRGLAQRSAVAAKEIKQLIDESVGKVDSGTSLVEQAGATMQQVTGAVRKVTAIIREISLASDEQKDGIDQVNKAITQMDGVTQQNAALVEEAAAAAISLQEQARTLQGAVAMFRYDEIEPGHALSVVRH